MRARSEARARQGRSGPGLHDDPLRAGVDARSVIDLDRPRRRIDDDDVIPDSG